MTTLLVSAFTGLLIAGLLFAIICVFDAALRWVARRYGTNAADKFDLICKSIPPLLVCATALGYIVLNMLGVI